MFLFLTVELRKVDGREELVIPGVGSFRNRKMLKRFKRLERLYREGLDAITAGDIPTAEARVTAIESEFGSDNGVSRALQWELLEPEP
jgi:hypothetical protein